MTVVFLSGSPLNWGDQARADKFNLVKKDFGVYQRVAMCQSKNKRLYCSPGDILIDDRIQYKKKWEDVGGTFVHYIDIKTTYNKLAEMEVL